MVQMTAYPTITPPSTLDEALAPILELSQSEFDHLVNATSSARSFSLRPDAIEQLKIELPNVANNLPFLLGALSFLYSQIDKLREGRETFDAIIAKLVDELSFDKSDDEERKQFEARLSILLAKNEPYGKFRKVERLQKGLVPNATSFKSMVDLRPDFGDSEDMSFDGLITVVQFQVSTDATKNSQKEFLFQLSEESLLDLRKAVERAEEKIKKLKSEQTLSRHFIKMH
jgi:hypothetical protein